MRTPKPSDPDGQPAVQGAEVLKTAVMDLLLPLKARVHTLISDNGMEFSRHEGIAQALEADYYFARPYVSWQRGLNGNANGLIRQYLPGAAILTR